MTTSPTPELDRLLQAEPDLVDLVFEYILSEPGLAGRIPAARRKQMESEVRGRLVGKVRQQSPLERAEMVRQVLHLFNGRNASEVARRLNIGRATVYRVIKQAHQGKKQSQVSGT